MSTVAVLGGGQNCEHDVSLASAASVAAALATRHDVIELTIGRDGRWLHEGALLGRTPARSLAGALRLVETADAVFPVLHGPLGEDGALAALCALAGLPCVGSPLHAGALAMDKWTTKLIAQAIGVPTATGRLVTAESRRGVVFDGPVVVKPVAAGSSYGVSLVRTADELCPALDTALQFDDRILVERFVRGREVDLAILEHADGTLEVGPPLEIVVPEGLFDTDRKYDGNADFRLPARLEPTELKELTEAATAIFAAIGCRGVARVDFFVTDHGVVLNEVNTMPGMTAESQVPKMFAAAGLAYADLLDVLVLGAR
jgi:D-alanine-D-alanine ligase